MADKKQSQKPISSTTAFFVVGDSPHERFEDMATKLLGVAKEEADEQATAYEREKSRKRQRD